MNEEAFARFFKGDPQNTNKLDPELKGWVRRDRVLGPCLKHPLVYQVPFFSWQHANHMFHEKKKYLEECMAANRFHDALWLYERPYRLTTLHEWWTTGTITKDQLREILPHAWMDTENSEEVQDISLEMFEAVEFVSDTDTTRPTGELIVYRGTQKKEEVGIEWSLRCDVAEWFARRWVRPTTQSWVTTAKVKGEHVLAYLTSRAEEEIIVNPKHVEIVKREQLPFQPQTRLVK